MTASRIAAFSGRRNQPSIASQSSRTSSILVSSASSRSASAPPSMAFSAGVIPSASTPSEFWITSPIPACAARLAKARQSSVTPALSTLAALKSSRRTFTSGKLPCRAARNCSPLPPICRSTPLSARQLTIVPSPGTGSFFGGGSSVSSRPSASRAGSRVTGSSSSATGPLPRSSAIARSAVPPLLPLRFFTVSRTWPRRFSGTPVPSRVRSFSGAVTTVT